MDVVVIVLLVLLGVIVLAKGKPLWSKLKTLLEQLEPLRPFIKETPLLYLLLGLGGIWFALMMMEGMTDRTLFSDDTGVLLYIGVNIIGIGIIIIKWILGPPYTKY